VTTPVRYVLYHVPSATLAALLLAWLWPKTGQPSWIAAVVWLAWIGKDAVLYPFVRHAYEARPATGAERLVGETGVAGTGLAPEGQVRVRGELWRARSSDGAEVPAGTSVVVERAEGLTLFVRIRDAEQATSLRSMRPGAKKRS
jgi:membrane-bound serine protease (ClpP class)